MGVTTQNGVDAAVAAGHFQVHVHAVVRQHNHHLRAFGTGFVDHLLHVLVLDAKGPVGHHVTWVSNGCVGKGLANDGAGHAVHFTHHIGFEHRIAKVLGLDVLRHKVDLARKVFLNDFLHAFHAIGEFPVACHHVHAQQFASVDHVLAFCPQRGGAALPGVPPIEQQGTRTRGFEAFDQSRQVRKAAHFAVATRGGFEVEVAHAIGLGTAGPHARRLEQMLAHQMRQLPLHTAQAYVDTGLAAVNRFELRVAVGHVQKRDLTKLGNVVQAVGGTACVGLGKGLHVQASHTASAQDLHEFAFGEVHISNYL